MKCSFCHAPLPLKGLHCHYCGKLNRLNAKVLQQETKSTIISKYLCPNCITPLSELEEVKYCKTCDGLFIEEERLVDLISKNIKKRKQNPLLLRFIKDNPRDNRKKTTYQPCPICQEKMQHLNYKQSSGVILDFCEIHGVWLDGGELRQIIEWEEIR